MSTLTGTASNTATAKPGLLQRLDDLSDWLSPIVVKEVRQMVRGREFNYSFGLSLVVGLIVAFFGGMAALNGAVGAGGAIFTALMLCLTLIGIAIVPLGTLNTLRAERSERTLDLITVTTMPPRRMIIGKLLSQGVKLVTLFAALAPFVATSFLLGGVDFITVALSLAALFVWSLWTCAAALLMSSLTKSRAVSMLATAGVALIFLMVAGLGRSLFFMMMYGGATFVSSPLMGLSSSSTAWWFAGMLAFCLTSMANLVLLAENRLSSPAGDRVTAVRIGLFIQFVLILTLVVSSLGGTRTPGSVPGPYPVGVLGVLAGLQLTGVAFFTVSEDLGLPRRLRLRMNLSKPRHWPLALFRPGGGRGAAYVLLQMAILLTVGWTQVRQAGDLAWLLAMCGYICFFTGVPACVGRRLSPRFFVAPQVRVAILMFFAVLSLTAELLNSWSSVNDFSIYQVISPIRVLANWNTFESNGWLAPVIAMGLIGVLAYCGLIYLSFKHSDDAAH